MSKQTLLVGTAAINKAIISIATRGKRLDADIQLAGLSVIAHVDQHGDTTLADKLVQAAPRGDARTALTSWLLAYSKMRLLSKDNEQEKAAIKEGRVFQLDKSRTTDMQGATEKAWHEFKKPTTPQDAFDAQAAVMGVIARLQSATSKGLTVKGRQEALDMLDKLRDAIVLT